MELSELIFKSNTEDLERVSNVIGGLVTDISKLDKASRDAAQTEAILARAAKDNAKANLDNAKAQDARLKSTITADKADKANEKSTLAKTKALESHTKASKENVSILQRQTDIYDFLAQGFSKGQASILASAKATGQYSKELEQVLELQKQFTSDPFDRSDTGLKRLQRTIKEVTDAQNYFNDGHNLTSKQARELSNDLDRLNAGMKQQGKSYQEITKAQAVYKQQFLEEARAVNQANSALAVVEKQRKDVVAATNYLTQADAKMAAALNTSNAALDKAGTDSLVQYETALRKSGISQDVATAKLAKYKAQLTQVNALEQKRREQHLARALSPQLTDIGVSLYSGQAPLTVLLQQGGQIADLLRLSGVEAKNFGKALRDAFSSMIPVMATVAKGLGQFALGLFQEAGAGVVGFIGKITGISAAMDIAKRAIASGGEENFRYIASLQRIGAVASTVAATGIAALIALLATMALEYKNIIETEKQLSVALATSGGAMVMSKDQAVAYAESMQSIGVGTLKAMNAIAEFAKVGKIGKDGLDLIIKSALDLEKYAGVSIAETAKQYAKLQDEPSKALTEIAEKTGLVDKATLDYVSSLEQQGDKTRAAEEATKALTAANTAMAGEIKGNLSPIEQLWNDITSAIGKAKQEIYDLTTSNANVSAMRVVWQSLAVTVSEFWFVLRGVGKELGGIAAQVGAMDIGAMDMLNPAALAAKIAVGFNSDAAKNIRKEMIADAEAARKAQDALVASIMNQGNEEKRNFTEGKEQNSQYAAWRRDNEKAIERQYSKEERLNLKKKQLQNDLNAGIIDEIKYKQALAGWERIIVGEKKPKDTYKQEARELDQYADILNKVNGLSSSYNNELATLQKLRSQNKITEEQYVQAVEDLIKLQPFYIKQQKEINAAHELSNRLLGKQDMLGKDYYKNLEEIDKYQKMGVENGGYSVEHAEKLRQAAFDQTQLAKENLKYIEDSTNSLVKYREEAQKSLDASALENAKLDDRVELLGLTSEQQKYLKIQQQQRNALLGVDLKLTAQIAKLWDDVRKGKMDPFDAMSAQLDFEKAAAEERKNINKEVAIQYREDFQKEFIDPIRNGLTDSIITALFEGGKAGSKKLRDVLVNTLRQKVTIVVDAVVNTLLGNVVGSLFSGGNAAGSVAGAAGSSLLGSVGGSLFGKAIAGNAGSFLGAGSLTGMLSNMWSGITTGFSTLFTKGIGAWFSQGTGLIGAGSLGGGLGALAGPLGAVLMLATGWKKLFGRELKDSGIQGEFGGETGFEGQQYKFYKGGLFRSDKTELSPLDESVRKTFADSFIAMKKQIVDFAGVLGLSADKLEGFSSSIKLSLKGLSEEDANKKILEAIATVNNEMAQQVIGTWETTTSTVSRQIQSTFMEMEAGAEAYRTITETIETSTYVASEYAKEGEKAIDTLTRLATSLSTVNQVFDTLGYTLYDASLAGGDLASKLIDLFGNIDEFVKSTTFYYQNFYSDQERHTTLMRQLDKEFKAHNLTLPKTRDEYRKLVEAQDLTTEEGRKMYAWLLQLAPAFAEVSEGMADTLQSIEQQLNSYYSQLEEAISSQNKELQKNLQLAQEAENKLNGLFNLLHSNILSLYGEVSSTRSMRASQGNDFISKALELAKNTGVLPDTDKLSEAINAVRAELVNDNFSSQAERDYAALVLAGQLSGLEDITEKQLTDAQKTVKALQTQIEQNEYILAYWKQQIEIATGTQQGVLSVEEAIRQLQNVLTGNDGPDSKPGGANNTGGDASGWVNPSSTPRVNYGAEEALGSFEKFKAWYQGLRNNADPNLFTSDNYKVPDWMKVSGKAGDGTDSELFKQYTFFKQNPQYAQDFESIFTTGKSNFSTDGSTLVKSDLSKMPAEAAEFFRNNPTKLMSYESLGLDPVLAYQLYKYGPEKFGLNGKKDNFTEWLRNNQWTESGIVAGNNASRFASMDWAGYERARYDLETGNIIFDGQMYTPDGQLVTGDDTSNNTDTFGVRPHDPDRVSNPFPDMFRVPSFDVGTNYVPRDMIAQIHEGEEIVPKAYNPAAGGKSNMARLEMLVEILTNEVRELKSASNKTAESTTMTAGILRNANNGSAIVTVTAPNPF